MRPARIQMLAIMGLFALPIIASYLVHYFHRPEATGNYGELLLPPARISEVGYARPGGAAFGFGELRGKWVLVVSDSAKCLPGCEPKLVLVRQVRLMLGRKADRVMRVFIADDTAPLNPGAFAAFEGMTLAATPVGMAQPLSAVNDRAHVYLVDPLGNVMMRWPANADPKRMLKDLERLLKASQIG
jgi:hypothetical protein